MEVYFNITIINKVLNTKDSCSTALTGYISRAVKHKIVLPNEINK